MYKELRSRSEAFYGRWRCMLQTAWIWPSIIRMKRHAARRRRAVDLLIPSSSTCSQTAFDLCSTPCRWGRHGYIEESGFSQLLRDVRIHHDIRRHERHPSARSRAAQLPMHNYGVVRGFLARWAMRGFAGHSTPIPRLRHRTALQQGFRQLDTATYLDAAEQPMR